jgi:glycosyltransferase involved in cell wall biosynthesis
MRICHIGDAQSVHMQRLTVWQAKRGHEVHLITDQPAEIEGVRVHEIKERDGSTLSFIPRPFQTRSLVKTIKPDVLHAHFLLNYGFFGAYSGFHPYIISMWANEIDPNMEPTLENAFLKLQLTKLSIEYTLKSVDLILTLENYQKQLCIKYGVPEAKIAVLYNYVNEKIFSPQKRSQQLRDELGLGDDPAVICLRGFESRYSVRTYIEAIPRVLKEVPNAKFILAGRSGSEEDRKNLMKLSKDLGIESSINFLGYIDQDHLPEYLASCDIHVDPITRGAGIGHGNMQAMSSGLARIAAYRPGVEEAVKDGITGYIYKAEDSKDLADKLLILLKDEDLRKTMGAECRKFVEDINERGQNEVGVERYYEELIARCKK